MAHFYGTLQGAGKEVTRRGHADLSVTAAGWGGAVKVELFVDSEGRDCYNVRQIKWQGVGVDRVLVAGVIGEETTAELVE
tara:strand:+ start:328 stop:567 length:240 start_codon:yes stop_codon:yes gene_type:complete